MNKNDLIWSYYLEFRKNVSFIEKDPNSYFYLNETQHYSNRISSKGWGFINSKTFEAYHLFGITLDKQELEGCFLNPNYTNPNYWILRNEKIYKRIANRFRRDKRVNHFIKKEHHKKKEISDADINKKDWREKKGFQKDHAKNHARRGAGKYYKKYSNKKHRNWERKVLFNENYEKMNDIDYRLFLDPWMWD